MFPLLIVGYLAFPVARRLVLGKPLTTKTKTGPAPGGGTMTTTEPGLTKDELLMWPFMLFGYQK